MASDDRPSGAMIVLERLTVRYGPFVAVEGLDLEVRRGELFGLLGPNGAGKSSTLRVLIGHGIANSRVPLGLARSDYRLFYTAGLAVKMHTYLTTHRLHPHMFRDVNRWIMRNVNAQTDELVNADFAGEL